jgi:hypothetical protein
LYDFDSSNQRGHSSNQTKTKNNMPDFKCDCSPGEVVAVGSCTIKVIPGKGVVNDVVCEKCGEFMELANPKLGECAGFTSNRYGQL